MPEPRRACHDCPACKAFDVLRSGLRSAAGFFFSLPISPNTTISYPREGSHRCSPRSSSHRKQRMGSTRPIRVPGFIHGTFKGAAVIPSSFGPRRPAFVRSHTTVGSEGRSLSPASGPTPSPSDYSLAHSASAHAVVSGHRSLASSDAVGNFGQTCSVGSQASLSSFSHSSSFQSLSSASTHSLASSVITLTPSASCSSIAYSQPSSSSYLLAIPSSTSTTSASSSSQSLAQSTGSLFTPSQRGPSAAASKPASVAQGHALSRSVSALSTNWKEGCHQKKPSVILYDSQRNKSSGREGILPALRYHVFGDKKQSTSCSSSSHSITKEYLKKCKTKDNGNPHSEASFPVKLKAKDKRCVDLGGISNVPTKEKPKGLSKDIPKDCTKEIEETKSASLSSKTKSKLRSRRDDLRRFTTSVLPSQILGFAKSAGRNTRKHENNSQCEKYAPQNPAKIQRLSVVVEQADSGIGASPLVTRRDGKSSHRHAHIPGRRETNVVPGHDTKVKEMRYLGNVFDKSCDRNLPFTAAAQLPSNSTTKSLQGADKGILRSGCFSCRGNCSNNSSSRRTGSNSSSHSSPPPKRSFLPLGTSASCSALVKPKPAPRTVFPTFNTPIKGFKGTAGRCNRPPEGAPKGKSPDGSHGAEDAGKLGRLSRPARNERCLEGRYLNGEMPEPDCIKDARSLQKYPTSTPLLPRRNPYDGESCAESGITLPFVDAIPLRSGIDNFEYYTNSSLDDSYTSHKGYLTACGHAHMHPKTSASSSELNGDIPTPNGIRNGKTRHSPPPYGGPPDTQDIPWITTPPRHPLKASRSLYDVNGEEGAGGSQALGVPSCLHEFAVSSAYSHRMLLSFGHTIENEVEGGSEKKWARTNSLRRQFNLSRENNSGRVHHQDPAAHSDTELGKISASHSLLDGECGSVGGGSVTSERGIDVGRVASWATSFEKLLEDPAGLHTFAEFLKKEYSHENIYFWTACERYKRLSSPDELQAMAKVISERHLCIGASEPVNVDSQARQDAQDSLHNPNEFLFSQAQKQIFNLMKFDSYSRFLKSSLYQDCLSRDMRGQTLPYPGDDTLDPDLKIIQDDSHVTLKKSKSDADERRRKSLLPWHRKDRSKSKDRGEAEYRRQKKMGHRNQSDSSSVRSDMSGSRTSLNSSDLGRRAISKESLTSGELGSLSGSEGYNRCRVILPDLSNSVVAVRHGDTIQELLTRLLERRGISYSTFDVYQNKSDKLMDKNEDSMALGGLEVRIERRILFRLDLPNRKTVCVKAKPNKLTSEVLKPILHKYGYKLDLMSIHKVGEEKGVNLKCHVNEIDGDRLVVQTKEEVKEWGVEPARQKKRGNSLDEITNRVFEDLLKGKSQQNFDELGILDFDARSSRTEHSSSDRSSGITGGFSLRNSLAPEKDIMSGSKVRKPANRSSVHDSLGVRGMMPPPDHALITKRRGNSSNPPNAKQENDELYEGLKRAQRSRLDDQRGTEINFELPDFLKCDQPLEDKENQHGAHLADQLLAHLECSFSEGGVIPSHQEAEDYFSMAHPEVWGGIPATSGPHSPNATLMAPDLDLDDFDDTLVADDSPSKVPMPDASNTSLHVDPPDFSPPPPISMENSVPALSRMIPPSLQLSPPPPLPPKPKLGGTRGPPPRPPSRQLHLLNPPTFSSSTSDDDTLHPSDHPPIHAGRQQGHHDKFNISFV